MVSPSSPRDWVEEVVGEDITKNYCCACGEHFLAGKERAICNECAVEGKEEADPLENPFDDPNLKEVIDLPKKSIPEIHAAVVAAHGEPNTETEAPPVAPPLPAEPVEERPSFNKELSNLINRHSRENFSNTPDFILADFLEDSLLLLEQTITRRREWHAAGIIESQPDIPVADKHLAAQLDPPPPQEEMETVQPAADPRLLERLKKA